MWTSHHAKAAWLSIFKLCFTSAELLATRDSSSISRISPEDWQALNKSVGGKLFATLPVGLPCYDNFNGEPRSPDEAACANVVANKKNMTFLTTQIGGYTQVRHVEIVWYLLTDCSLREIGISARVPGLDAPCLQQMKLTRATLAVKATSPSTMSTQARSRMSSRLCDSLQIERCR